MNLVLIFLTAATLVASQPSPDDSWSQCGGIGFTRTVICASGYTCSTIHPYWAQCLWVFPTTTTRSTGPVPTKSNRPRDADAYPTTFAKTTTTARTAKTTKTSEKTTTKTSKTTKTTKTTTVKTTKASKTSSTKTTTSSAKPTATGLDALIKKKGKNYIGVAVDWNTLAIPEYEAIVKEEFGSITAEWSMKWEFTQPSRGEFFWDYADTIVNWGIANNKNIRGHTFVWHTQSPKWVLEITDPVDMRQVIWEFVSRYAARYAGKIETWDVVNEVFEDDGSWRQTPFYNVLGPDYVELAFRAARVGDPHAKLCINDFNLDWDNGKVNSTIALVNSLRAKGVPIDCIGTQAHLVLNSEDNPLLGNIWDRLSDETGVELQVTELDIRMYTPPDAQKLVDQRVDFGRAVSACMKNKRCTSVTLWTVTDGLSWVPTVFPDEGAPLLWDENYQKKPAYYGVIDGINTV